MTLPSIDRPCPDPRSGHGHVVTSELVVPEEGIDDLEDAFRHRLGAVDSWPGFEGLQVWRDPRQPGRYVMVSWWSSEESFRAYLHSEDHRRSHERVPGGEHRPRPVSFSRFQVVAR